MNVKFEIRTQNQTEPVEIAETRLAADRLLTHLQRTYIDPLWIVAVTKD